MQYILQPLHATNDDVSFTASSQSDDATATKTAETATTTTMATTSASNLDE